MTSVAVYSHTHSVTYVADAILKTLKDVLRLCGLSPTKFVDNWELHHRGVRTWLDSGHLERVMLEIFDPKTDALVGRWDLDIRRGADGDGDGEVWIDTEQVKYHIRKAGLLPADASYRLLITNKSGRPDVVGWAPAKCRSTDGFERQSLGATVEHNGLGAQAAYWRKSDAQR